jgi:HPt (histidine-containing phosphotransfer) domain-containing protein
MSGESDFGRERTYPEPVAGDLDLDRLAELPETLGVELPEIIATLVRELDDAVAQAQTSIAAGEFAATARAAHSGRNSALMVGAEPVLAALGQLETVAGEGDAAAARAALDSVRDRWATLRARLELAAQDDGRDR